LVLSAALCSFINLHCWLAISLLNLALDLPAGWLLVVLGLAIALPNSARDFGSWFCWI